MSAFRLPGLIASYLRGGWPQGRLLHTLALDLAKDPLQPLIAKGVAAGHRWRLLPDKTRMHARAIRDQGRATGERAAAISQLLSLIGEYPGVEEFQKITVRLLHEMHDPRSLEAWLGFCLRFPDAMDGFHSLATLAHKQIGPAAVYTIIRARFPQVPTRLDQLLAYAEAADLAGAMVERQAAFGRLAVMFGKRRESWLGAVSWLEEEAGIRRSVVKLLKHVAAGAGLRTPIFRERQRLREALHSWDRDDLHSVDPTALSSVKVLGALFDRILERRPIEVSRRKAGEIGSVLLLTGSLGTGGAERQLVNTAVGLGGMTLNGRTLRDGVVLDPVRVVARSLRDRRDGMFFLDDLQRAEINVHTFREFPDFGGDLGKSTVRPALGTLGFLPWSTAESVMKLTDWLRTQKPEVVHIWQDGLIYAAGLAALLAGVPRIVLSGRSAPPPDRKENYLVEYDIIYKSLLRAPGVKLSVNSHYAARRYASWLDMDLDSIPVIHNGVKSPSPVGDALSEAAFAEFDERTRHSTLTVGAVMRLDDVKRPSLWIEAAAAIFARIPLARFIIVGDGPLRKRTERLAASLGIAERCLFTGRSTCVGFWLAKMDTLVLLSEHEGLPNALIEAQLAGVPVITSAAGGAVETVITGATGMITSQTPTPGEVADIIVGLIAEPGRLTSMGRDAAQWARQAFPVSRMLGDTLEVYAAAGAAQGQGPLTVAKE